jgi:hypothetical protein
MKKYIYIITLTLAYTAWSMDHKQRSFKAVNPSNLEATIRSFQTDADRKAGLEILDIINERTGILSPTKAIPQNFSPSSLFVIHHKHPEQRPSKL